MNLSAPIVVALLRFLVAQGDAQSVEQNAAAANVPPPSFGTMSIASLAFDGTVALGSSAGPAISGDGRYVAFFSDAANLVPGDSNGKRDVFVRDRLTQTTILASTSAAGAIGNGDSAWPSISFDGRFVSFESNASNLVPGDTGGHRDVFVKDLATGAIERVSVANGGTAANGDSFFSRLSPDARYVVFESEASNLVVGDSNGVKDVFLRDRVAATTVRASVATSGGEGNGDSFSASVSSDGRFVLFLSSATDLVVGDTNGVDDVFLRDILSAVTVRLSQAQDGSEANGLTHGPRMTPDALTVVFSSQATNLVPSDEDPMEDVYRLDRLTGAITRVSRDLAGAAPNNTCYAPDVSADGKLIVYSSFASNLVDEDNNGREDAFVFDVDQGVTLRVSVSNEGLQNDGFSGLPAISPDGRLVTFISDATQLVESDTNSWVDVFAFDFSTGGPPPPLPFLSLDLKTARGRIANSKKVASDTIAISGTFTFKPVSVDGKMMPNKEATELRIGDPFQPFVVQIPANDPGWKAGAAGAWTWRSKKGTSPVYFLRLDPKKGRILFRGTRLDWSVFPVSSVLLRSQVGDDLGIDMKAWKANKLGTVLHFP